MMLIDQLRTKEYRRRVWMSLAGVVICGISVGFFKLADFGVDPFQCFMAGLNKLIPIPFGILYMIVNLLLLVFSLIADRHYIGLATFINLFLLGYITQLTLFLLKLAFPEPGILIRIISLVVGIIILCFASSLYITADLGVSTYDAISLIIVNTWKKGRFRYVRVIADFICIAVGCLLFILAGGKPLEVFTIAGAGTVVTAFFMGPVIEFFNVKIAQPILRGKRKKADYQIFH